MEKPFIITMGDPTGVGPEIIVKALLAGAFDRRSRPLLVAGDVGVLQKAAVIFDVPAIVAPASGQATHRLTLAGRELAVHALSDLDASRLQYGKPDNACGLAMAGYIEWACARCQAGEAAAMITAPISKAAIHAAGYDFPGHTELLAERCGSTKVVMMLAGDRLKVCLVTTHLALREVPAILTTEEILETIRIIAAAFRRYFGSPAAADRRPRPEPACRRRGAVRRRGGATDRSRHRRGAGWKGSPPAGRTAPTPFFTSPPRGATTPSSACTTTRG